jgi:hypothetical protein
MVRRRLMFENDTQLVEADSWKQKTPSVSLVPGDMFRCRRGPYFVSSETGKLTPLGRADTFTLKGIAAPRKGGKRAYLIGVPVNGRFPEMVYVGGEFFMEDLGIMMQPHIITKCRKKTVANVLHQTGKKRKRKKKCTLA